MSTTMTARKNDSVGFDVTDEWWQFIMTLDGEVCIHPAKVPEPVAEDEFDLSEWASCDEHLTTYLIDEACPKCLAAESDPQPCDDFQPPDTLGKPTGCTECGFTQEHHPAATMEDMCAAVASMADFTVWMGPWGKA